MRAELPGIDEKDLELSINDNMLTIRGEKKRLKEEKDGDHYFGDIYYGSFRRTFQLPADIVQEMTAATFNKGVLRIRIPKVEGSKTKKIKIKNE